MGERRADGKDGEVEVEEAGFIQGLRRRPAVIAMLHAPSLLAAPPFGTDGEGGRGGGLKPGEAADRLIDHLVRSARAAAKGGADALLVENYGDAPFSPVRVAPHVISLLSLAARRVREEVDLPLGVNVLRNDARAALAVAFAAGGAFVRVNVLAGVVATDQGVITGRADRVLEYRARLGTPIAILADVDVKHGRPLWGESIGERARDLWERAGADALIVTGAATGRPPAIADLEAVRAACPGALLLTGSGLTPENAGDLLPLADGAIVGTAVECEEVSGAGAGLRVDERRMEAVVAAARRAWAARLG
jgi:membrane complex biogenesis BtpA family protein